MESLSATRARRREPVTSLLLVALSLLLASCAPPDSAEPGSATVPPTTSTEAGSSDTLLAPLPHTTAGPFEVPADGLRIELRNVRAEWMNEDYVVLDGQIEVENLDLSGELTSLYGWFATCSERPELDVWDYGFRQSVQLTSRPVGGFDSFFTSEFVIEPLTSTEIELPTIAYPAKDSLLPTECGDIEVAVFIYTLHRMLVVEALDLNGILRDLGPPPDQAWIGRDELCDALVAQDLQALYGYPITKWESADEIIGTPGAEGKLRNRFYFPSQCVFGTTSILVSNSASVQSGLRYDTAHRELRDVGDGVRLTASVDVLVESGNTLVYIQDDSNNGGLDADQLATLGRLISRLVDQIKD